MSFILDALKKSELERQRQSIPGLVDAGPAAARSRLPTWALVVGVLLAVNLAVLTVMLMRGSAHGPGAAPSSATAARARTAGPAGASGAVATESNSGGAATAGAATAAAEDHFSPLDANQQPVYAPEIPVARSGDGVVPPTSARAQSAEPAAVAEAGTAKPGHRDPLLTSDDYKPADEEVLPTISEISLTGAQTLPELHLDVHVFSTKAAERFVYINMRKYHEGATLQEGPVLERIRRDGVILDYQGLRFLLPRQ